MKESTPEPSHFTAESFRFLKELTRNNNRAWFTENKGRYEASILGPSREFVRSVGPKLGAISPHLFADDRPVGGSITRIYRDVRFSKDKSPYKTSMGFHFWHDATQQKEDHLPGFFLHLAPSDTWVYAGMWMPDAPRLQQIRSAIVARPADWRKVRDAVPEIEGEALKRPPPGFSADHPYIEDLKRKAFTAGLPITDAVVTLPNFPAKFVTLCASLSPLNRFLAKAIKLDY